MEFWAIIFLGVGLSMDSLVVSATCGVILRKFVLRELLIIAVFLGFFQGLMPLMGWLIGTIFQDYISTFDHWIAMILLCVIGFKMIWEGIFSKSEGRCFDPMDLKVLTGLAIATSIDALAVGLSLGLLETKILIPSLIIGLITFIVAFSGILAGIQLGKRLNFKIEIIGGIVLIFIGMRILITHMSDHL